MNKNQPLQQKENFIEVSEEDNEYTSLNLKFSKDYNKKSKKRNNIKSPYKIKKNKNIFKVEISNENNKNNFLGIKRKLNLPNYNINKKNDSTFPNNITTSDIYGINLEDLDDDDDYSFKKSLPIYPFKQEILEKIKQNRIIIISGNTGCGKSTQVPQYIYYSDDKNSILMTQPRRIAAVSIAKRLSNEMGLKLGNKIGFHVSMNSNFCKDTRIVVETTGIFMEELIHKNIEYSHIILDEVHERDINVDLVLALIKWYFENNPSSKTKLILMSATIAERSFAEYLKEVNGKDIPIIRIKESLHKIHEFTLEKIFNYIKQDKNITEKIKSEVANVNQSCLSLIKSVPLFMNELFPVVSAILEKIENENKTNKKGVLIFVPGISEIQELQDYISRCFVYKNNLECLILHSLISDIEQDKIFKNTNNKRKIILATNIAESSITIANIDFVIDFCLVKQTRFDEIQNSSLLELKWCSKANCQQRKGRTGRINSGYYFQLIPKKLADTLDNHPKPEILRTTLENPILKLKIYDSERQPSEILLKTINPPKEGNILRAIFNLEKMGALIKGELKEIIVNNEIKRFYKSGIITKIGRIFAELPIDIKYSRLIMISFALGEIDLGITLAAILSQEKSIFLNSDKCNRLNLYNSKNYYCFNKECDFIASYTAYKKWYYDYGHELVNLRVKFDTQLKYIDKDKYLKIKEYTNKNILDFRVLKEVIRVENDLKKRLAKFRLYSINSQSYKTPKISINFKDEDNAFLLKIILTGTFYNNIFVPEYECTRNIEKNILDVKNSEKHIELRTIRLTGISVEEAEKICEIFEAIAEPNKIIDDQYNENCESYKLVFDKIEPVKKILFMTSTSIIKNKQIPIFLFKNDTDNNNENTSNNISEYEKTPNVSEIKLSKEPEYYYRLRYYDEYLKDKIYQEKDSINFIQIIPDLEKLRNIKLVTDAFHGRFNRNNNYKKYSKNSSVLPTIENFDKLMMMVFAPKYEMVGVVDEKTNKIIKYKGFLSHDFTGLSEFSDKDIHDMRFDYKRAVLVKFDYLITNYHMNIINEIRVLINDIIKFKFINKNKDVEKEKDKEDDLTKEEYDELYAEYKTKARKVIEQIKFLLNIKKIRNINNENFQDLYDYINDIKYKNKMIHNFHINSPISENSSFYSFSCKSYSENFEIENENENEDENEENNENQEENFQSYQGYINAIYDLKKKVQPDDFLQIHEPLQIESDFIFTDKKTLKEIKSRNFKIQHLYNNFVKDLKRKENLISMKNGYLLCAYCHSEICEITEDNYPILTNKDIGEYNIKSSWMNDNLKLVYKKNKKIDKCLNLDEEKMKKFMEILQKEKITYQNLLCCNSGKHIVGYVRDNEKYIFYGSEITVKYPDLSYEHIKNNESFMNDFIEIRKKIRIILEEKKRDDFKNNIFCKLCNFYVKNDLSEFKAHLKDKEHEEKMEELRREFI